MSHRPASGPPPAARYEPHLGTRPTTLWVRQADGELKRVTHDGERARRRAMRKVREVLLRAGVRF